MNIAWIITLLSVAACSMEEYTPEGAKTICFTGTIEKGSDTKTVLMNNGSSIWWEPGDAIRVFCNGQNGVFTSSLESPNPTSSFVGDASFIPAGASDYLAIYPSPKNGNCYDGTYVTVNVPSQQIIENETFDKRAFIMIAQSKNHLLNFKNLCGGVKILITQEGVNRIILRGNNYETIAGTAKVAFVDGVPMVERVIESKPKIELFCKDNTSFKTDTWYYISCLPTILSNGFTIELWQIKEDSEALLDSHALYTYDTSTCIERSTWGRVSNVDDAISYSFSSQRYVFLYKQAKTWDGAPAQPLSVYDYYDEATGFWVGGYYDSERLDHNYFQKTPVTQVIIPYSIINIGEHAFYKCFNLENVTIPNSVRSIGAAAFKKCHSLRSLSAIPDGVTSIRDSTFYECYCLESVNIPKSVNSIGKAAFGSCASLTSVIIPEGVESIKRNAFGGCQKLTNVSIPSTVTSIGEQAFYNCISLESVIIPNSVTSIEDAAFFGCSALKTVAIPESVTSIEGCVFTKCTGLINVTIPESITAIGIGSFSDCTSLASVTIPSSVTRIAFGAFKGCTSLKSVTVLAQTPPRIDSTTFAQNASDRVFYVPYESVELYKTAEGWKDYASFITYIQE